MMLNVTHTEGRDGWTGYVVLNGRAVAVAHADFNGLDDLRYYANREGYEGILHGSPSVPWGKVVDCVDVNRRGTCKECGVEFGSYHAAVCKHGSVHTGSAVLVQRKDC